MLNELKKSTVIGIYFLFILAFSLFLYYILGADDNIDPFLKINTTEIPTTTTTTTTILTTSSIRLCPDFPSTTTSLCSLITQKKDNIHFIGEKTTEWREKTTSLFDYLASGEWEEIESDEVKMKHCSDGSEIEYYQQTRIFPVNPSNECSEATFWRWKLKAAPNQRNWSVQYFSQNETRQCLAGKWIYLIGDSSTRITFSALIQQINGTVRDLEFPDHRRRYCMSKYNFSVENCGRWVKGQLPYLQNLDQDAEVYFREFWEKEYNIRITYSFKSEADLIPLSLLQTISKSHQPDLVVLNTGAWSNYHGLSPTRTFLGMQSFMEYFLNVYSGPLIYQNLATCAPAFHDWAVKYNQLADGWFRERNYPVLNRALMTSKKKKNSALISSSCEGWHTWDFLAEELTSWLVNSLCEKRE